MNFLQTFLSLLCLSPFFCAVEGMEKIRKIDEKYQKIATLLHKQFGFSNQKPDNSRHICLSADGKTVYTNYYTHLSSFDVYTGEPLFKIKASTSEPRLVVKDFIVRDDEKYAAAITDKHIFMYDLYYKTVKRMPLEEPYNVGKYPPSLAISQSYSSLRVAQGNWILHYDFSLLRKPVTLPINRTNKFSECSFVYLVKEMPLSIGLSEKKIAWKLGVADECQRNIVGAVRYKPVLAEGGKKFACTCSSEFDRPIIYVISFADDVILELHPLLSGKQIQALAINNDGTRVVYGYTNSEGVITLAKVALDGLIIDKKEGGDKISILNPDNTTIATSRKKIEDPDVHIAILTFLDKSNAYVRLMLNNGYIEDINMLAEKINDDL